MLLTQTRRTGEFEAFALPYLGDLYQIATRLINDPLRADEAVLATYQKAAASFQWLEPGTDRRVWLYQILFRCLPRDEWPPSAGPENSAGHLSSVQEPTDDDLLTALSQLPRDARAVVLLMDVEEFSLAETAAILRCRHLEAHSLLIQGRKLLRARLAMTARPRGFESMIQEGLPA